MSKLSRILIAVQPSLGKTTGQKFTKRKEISDLSIRTG